MSKPGRPQTVSKITGDNDIFTRIESIVQVFKTGGGYIPVPRKYKGRNVTIFIEK